MTIGGVRPRESSAITVIYRTRLPSDCHRGQVALPAPALLRIFDEILVTWLESTQRIAPAQRREAGEIAVTGTEFRTVLDGKGGKMGIGRQVSSRAERQN